MARSPHSTSPPPTGSLGDLLDLLDGITCPRTSNSSRARRGRPLGQTALAIRGAVDDLTARFERMTVGHVDAHAWNVERAVEADERQGLLALAGAWNGGSSS